jgi:DNA-3-methyladenine glycosylase II
MGSKRPPYFAHLALDERLKPLLAGHPAMELTVRKDLWLYLTVAVMAQQLSTRVASVIRQRFMDLYGGEPTPERVLATPVASLRAIGLSNAKAAYIHNIARFDLESGISLGVLQAMTDAEVLAYLTQIKGVGQWTAEMFLMFALGREDVFSAGDLGLQQAMIKIYRLRPGNKKAFRERLLKISSKWSPYRSYASLHLWHHKDAPTVAG